MSLPSDLHLKSKLLAVFIILLSSACTVMGQLDFGQPIKLTDPLHVIDFSGAVDMDGDGDIDLFATTVSGLQFDWCENDGSGNFTRHRWRPETLSQEIFGIADWNGDGRQDLWILEILNEAGTTIASQRYLVAHGEPNGSFGDPVTIIATQYDSRFPREALIADINGDGRHDIIESWRVFLQNTNGTFSPPVLLPTQQNQLDWVDIRLQDFDRDGDQDIFVIQNSETIRYLKNEGNGSFASAVNLLSVPAGENLDEFIFAESNLPEAAPRLITLTSSVNDKSKLSCYDQTPDRNLVKISELLLPKTVDEREILWSSLHRDSYSLRVFVCNVDPNPLASTRLFEIRATSSGLVIDFLSKHGGITLLGFTTVHDLNLDGNDDLIVPVPQEGGWSGSAADHIVWFEGNSNGGFSETEKIVIAPFYTRSVQHLGDLDGDGDNDLLFQKSGLLGSNDQQEGFSIWSNNGNGQSYEKREFGFDGTLAGLIAVEDFVSIPPTDGAPPPLVPFTLLPGRQDLIFATYHWSISTATYYQLINIAFQDSNGNFTNRVIESLSYSGIVYYEDLDRDGMKDLVFLESNGDIGWSRRVLNSFHQKTPIMNLSFDSGLGEGAFRIIDIDRDDDLDFFARGSLFGPSSSYWVERDAGGEILAVRKLPKGLLGLTYDADGDGYEDFINADHKIVLLRSNMTFEITDRILMYPNFYRFDLFDLDDDGDLDGNISATLHGTTGFQTLFWSECLGESSNYSFAPEVLVDEMEFASRNQFAVGDMDGDGQNDLIVVSTDTALVELFRITRKAGPTAFRQWMSGQGITGSSAGPFADWDGDSISNWEEFVFGTQAKIADLASNRRPHLEMDAGEMAFTFQKRNENSGINLQYQTQRSTRLDDWENWNPEQAQPESNGDYQIVRIPVTLGEDAEFFRVKLPEIPQ